MTDPYRRLRVVVIGGGISGLAAAWELVAGPGPGDGRARGPMPEGPEVVVLEASPRLGGRIRSGSVGGGVVDLGPDAFVARRPEVVQLCAELGLSGELVAPGAKGASVWARGRLRPLPDGLAVGIPTRFAPLARSGILGPLELARVALDLLPRRAGAGDTGTDPSEAGPRGSKAGPRGSKAEIDTALGPLVARHLGDATVRRLVDPLMGGINAGPVATMSTASVFPPALGAGRGRTGLMGALRSAPDGGAPGAAPTPPLMRVRGGMVRLVADLVDGLVDRDVSLRTSAEVGALAPQARGWALHTDVGEIRADAVVVAVPAPAAGRLLGNVLPDGARDLLSVAAANVTTVTMAFAPDAMGATSGTGFLVPVEQGLLLTGCTWLDAKWPELAQPGQVLVRASCGRFGDDRADALSDDDVVERVVDELRAVAGVTGRPHDVLVNRWPGAFPQYEVGHRTRMEALGALVAAAPAPLALAGPYLAGVGLPACVGSGRQAARLVQDALARAGAGVTAR
jgi:protoporphyrinogen/coproporphyrinogen III oxidase